MMPKSQGTGIFHAGNSEAHPAPVQPLPAMLPSPVTPHVGDIEKRASGGNVGSSGLLHSSVAGRTDQLQVSAPSGAYVIPADVVSGIGEGNTLAGARFLQAALETGPWGTPLPKAGLRNTIPRAKGGRTEHKPVLILGAGGEFLVHPKDVLKIGRGDLKRGHAILDKWVVAERQKIAKEMLKLPGPVKS
jgi:hypothetical protein